MDQPREGEGGRGETRPEGVRGVPPKRVSGRHRWLLIAIDVHIIPPTFTSSEGEGSNPGLSALQPWRTVVCAWQEVGGELCGAKAAPLTSSRLESCQRRCRGISACPLRHRANSS